MRKLNPVPQDPSTDPVYLASAAVHSLIHLLPSGTAFFIGVVLIVMMTGRLVHHKGSLARAASAFCRASALGLAPRRAGHGAWQSGTRWAV